MNQIDKFFFYFWNRWNKIECLEIFGDDYGNYIWGKYENATNNGFGKLYYFYTGLDSENKAIILNRIKYFYGDGGFKM